MERCPAWLRVAPALLLASAALVAGCAGNPTMGGGDPKTDLSVPCVGPKCTDPNGCDKESDCTDPARPHCEVGSHKCVPCLSNLDCELGRVCFPATHTCTAGCAPGHGCPSDGGVCEVDAGSCVECNGDSDCLDSAKPRCDLVTRRCFECNPQNDNCGFALVCLPNNNEPGYACKAGCKDDTDCKTPGASDDGGDVPDGGTPNNAPWCEPKKHVCVRCLVDDDCPNGKICKGNACIAGCTDLHACDNSLACCDIAGTKACTDTNTDFQNCGGCGVQCQGGWNCCGAKCSNPVNDVDNCGTCGNPCSAPNGVAACAQRACVIAQCNMGWADCNGVVKDGCETHTDVNPNNCGACNNACSLSNAQAKCVGGACQVGSCLQGWGNCNNKPEDGCEIDIAKDPANCGGCGNACSNKNIAQPVCGMGVCTGACNAGFADCNMNKQSDGCEVDLKTDVANCGSCGTVCANSCQGNVAATTCAGGACAVTMCAGGTFDVDKQCANGCECKENPGGAAACMMAATINVGLKSQALRLTGTLITQPEVWFAFSFQGLTDPSIAYHPAIQLLPNDNPKSAFGFTIFSDCNAMQPICGSKDNPPKANGEIPGQIGWVAWEVAYDGALGPDGNAHPTPNIVGNDVGKTISGNASDFASHLIPIPVSVTPMTVFVRVRRNGMVPATACGDYTFTLTVSNG